MSFILRVIDPVEGIKEYDLLEIFQKKTSHPATTRENGAKGNRQGTFSAQQRETLIEFLTLLDDLQRSIHFLEHSGREQDAKGLRMIERKALQLLQKRYGVTPIEAVGTEFSPQLHCAVEHIQDHTLGSGVVIYEYKKGYLQNGTVLRYSEVVVAN